MNSTKRIIRALKNCAIKCLYILISKIPLNNNVVFECESDLQDNPRAIYDYLVENKYNYKHTIVWIVNDVDSCRKKYQVKNVKFFNRKTSNGLDKILLHYYLSTSKYLFFSHPYWFRKWRHGQKVVNTTHSVAQLKAANSIRNVCDYVLCCSDYCRKIKEISFGTKVRYLVLGLPRLDYMFKHKNCESLSRIIADNKYLIVSMETFKQSTNWKDSNTTDKYAINVISKEEDMIYLDNLLKSISAGLVIKIHHLQDMSFISTSNFTNIVYITDNDLIEHDIQVNELLENANLLITDYSSVFYDYLLVDRPIGFMIGDYNDYKRGFVCLNPFDEMPGEIISSKEELYKFILDSRKGIDRFAKQREMIRNKVFIYRDDNNCNRLYEWMRKGE